MVEAYRGRILAKMQASKVADLTRLVLTAGTESGPVGA